jgi:hypothetical protein
MMVESDRRYRFPVPACELWSAMADVEEYRRWWPWLRSFDGRGLVAGDRWHCVVQPPLPYAVRFTVAIDEVVEAERVTATVEGDVVGTASIEIREDGEGCEARLASALAPNGRALRVLATVARPVVRFGHDWVLDAGAREFRAKAVPG